MATGERAPYPAQPLEALAILGIDETIGVERVAIEERGPVAGPGKRGAARNEWAGHGLGLLGREEIRWGVVAVEREAALDEAVDRAGDLLEQADDDVKSNAKGCSRSPRLRAPVSCAVDNSTTTPR